MCKCVSGKQYRLVCAPGLSPRNMRLNATGQIWKANQSKLKTAVFLPHHLKGKKKKKRREGEGEGCVPAPPVKPSVHFIHSLVNSCHRTKAKHQARQDCACPQAATRPHNWVKMIQYKTVIDSRLPSLILSLHTEICGYVFVSPTG